MPVRSSGLSILKWPDPQVVRAAARDWARGMARRPEVLRIGIFGSYARGDAGVGSDLDLVVVVRDSSIPFQARPAGWHVLDLPVPAEVLVYTEAEWNRLRAAGGRFARMLNSETDWIYRA